jgi:hypothetical protein
LEILIKKILIFIVIILLFTTGLQNASARTTYVFDWFNQSYPPGSLLQTFSNVNNSGVNFIFTVTGDTSKIIELVDNNEYIGAQTGDHEALVNRLDLNKNAQVISVTVSFSIPVSNVNFVIHDIDRQSYNNYSTYNYLDNLKFSGQSSDGSTIVYPQFSSLGKCVAVSANQVSGTGGSASDPDCQAGANTGTNYGDVTVYFPQEITQFSYVYGNLISPAYPLDNNTVVQVISLDDISFDSVWDYGDMPDTFSTSGVNAARHRTSPGQTLYLGSVAPYDEFVSNPTLDASGDNSPAVEEEALSALPNINATMTDYILDVPLVNGSGSAATLMGWIDLNDDGVFTSSEMVSSNVAPGDSIVRLTWSGFTLLVPDSTYLRLRLTSNTSGINMNTSAGSAPDGEVEDYVLEVGTATPITLLSFSAKPEKNELTAIFGLLVLVLSVILLPFDRIKYKLGQLRIIEMK